MSAREKGPRRAGVAILAACFALSLWIGQQFWVQPLQPLPTAILPCVSYAPFRDARHSPFDPALRFTRQQLERDLQAIQAISPCVRTYGLDHGMDAVADVARSLGLRLRMGVWLGHDRLANRREIEMAVAVAHAYSDVIDMVIVGNEVLLRGDLPVQELVGHLAEIRARVAVPVTYADVWAFWQRFADALVPHVDLVTVHILPYWEDVPVGVDDAVDYVHQTYGAMQAMFAPLPVWVGETGWPARGRARGAAIAEPQAQRFFVHALLGRQATTPIDFNLIEAFDQPWKRVQEGAMGGAWGVFASDASRRVDWTVPQSQTRSWVVIGLLALCWAAVVSVGRAWRLRLGLGLLIAGSAAMQLEMGWTWSRTTSEWLRFGLGFTVAIALSLLLARRVYSAVCVPKMPNAGYARYPRDSLLWALTLVWLGLALWQAYGLAVDGRYRAIHWPLLVGPVALGAAWRLAAPGQRFDGWSWLLVRILALLTGFVGVFIFWAEGFDNPQALTLAGLSALLVFVFGLLPWQIRRRPGIE